jgi:hypothetical protein
VHSHDIKGLWLKLLGLKVNALLERLVGKELIVLRFVNLPSR